MEKFVKKNGNFHKLINAIKKHEKVSVFGFTSNEQVGVFYDIDDFVLYVAPNITRAYLQYNSFLEMGKSVEIISEPFGIDYNNINKIQESKINEILYKMVNDKLDILVINSNFLFNKLHSREYYRDKALILSEGLQVNFKKLTTDFVQMGYKKVDSVEYSNEFAVRGDVVDIYPINNELGYRISVFGNEIEYIKKVDFANNVYYENVDEIEIFGGKRDDVNEVVEIAKKHINKELSAISIKSNINNTAILNNSNIKNTEISNDLNIKSQDEEKEYFLHLLNEFELENYSNWIDVFDQDINNNILSLIPENSIIVYDEPKQIIDNASKFYNEFLAESKEKINQKMQLAEHKNFYVQPSLMFNSDKANGLVSFGLITTSNRIFSPGYVFSIACGSVGELYNNKALMYFTIKQYYQQNFTQIIYCGDLEFANNLHDNLRKESVASMVVANLTDVVVGSVNLVCKKRNVTMALPEEKLVIIGTNKLIKTKNDIKTVAKNSGDDMLSVLPKIGDYVVHDTHGIGKCIDIEKISINNLEKDYLVIAYLNNDKLFLPVENLDSVTKYVGGDENPKLNKLGGVDFYKAKQKVKGQLKEVASDLVKLYALRQNKAGINFPVDDELQEAFEQDFPYTETPDQLSAIEDMKSDMQSSKIMDRLICGDVGYGKTEVALRAIFKAVSAGYQVAFLSPTTILSQQHYNTCVARLAKYGVVVDVLNRFKSVAQQKQIISDLKDGKINVVCGTHRLISKDVGFKNIGLLVLDEEQKFGVSDKEKIKQLKENIDVLTLSATPIPRSLHMSLTGIRDISIIDTPPPMKLPIVSQVIEYSDMLVKEAVDAEISRGGQVLVIFNNVTNIYNFYSHLKNLLSSDINISVAHGQMTESELENEVYKLYEGTTQVLISTTLIENGIDLPSANTIIIINSDMLGLSQLYQLKGRVGRGSMQAYAYFTYDKSKVFNENASKRMRAISELTQLGDGYKIALKDLEIRGAGSVLGHKQHGHLLRVGYAMYVNLLQEVVKELKGEIINRIYDVKIDTDFNANLPNYFVSSVKSRIKIYSDISKLTSINEVLKFTENLKDNYSQDVPVVLENLCYVGVVKNASKYLPIKKIAIKNMGAVVEFENEFIIDNLKFLEIIKKHSNKLVLKNADKLILSVVGHSSIKQLVETIVGVFGEITQLFLAQNNKNEN